MQSADGNVHSAPYNSLNAALHRGIAILQERAYGPSDAATANETPLLHDPSLDAWSYFLRENERIVSYAGVVTKTILHNGQSFVASGLACVATDPDHRRRGLGRQVVAAATHGMEQRGGDLGVFTCAPHLAALYAGAGSWPIASDVVLLGSQESGALTSASLNVVVLMRLFSERARAASSTLLHGTIDLDLPPGEFW